MRNGKRILTIALDGAVCDDLPRLYRHLENGKLNSQAENVFEVIGDPPVQDARWAIKKFRNVHKPCRWEVFLFHCRDFAEAEAVAWKWLAAEGIRANGMFCGKDQDEVDEFLLDLCPNLLVDPFQSDKLLQVPKFQTERYQKFVGTRIMTEVFRNNWQDIVDRHTGEGRKRYSD